MKTHLNFGTAHLSESISFYATLLETRPAKVLADYALFVTDDPGMELALDARATVDPPADAHYGVCVESTAQVERAIERLTAARLAASVEREETCCYAKQTKVWTIDPDGRRWEVYTVHEEAGEIGEPGEPACCPA
jgi:catechol 2,3-dioxygenase-like lactoylglutathione lyase family enzyme